MFRSSVPSSQSALSPERTLELANLCLENARTTKNPEVALELCAEATTVLSRMKQFLKTSAPPTDSDDQSLREGIATTYLEIGKLQDSLRRRDKALVSYKKADKWSASMPNLSLLTQASRSNIQLPKGGSKLGSGIAQVSAGPLPVPDRDMAVIHPRIFPENTLPPTTVSKLPEPSERLIDTPQLVCCLGLLQARPSSDDIVEQTVQDWIKTVDKDTDEQERLRTLAVDVIREYLRDELKDTKAVAEVVRLAPVLERDDFRDLLRQFYMGIDKSGLLNLPQLEGLAEMIQNASPGYLDTDDLVKTLEFLGTRLRNTHQQSTNRIYQLTVVVSHVLDAMADSKVRGLDRENLHEPLSAYLEELQKSDDPHLVYQSAYAYQALLYVPDNETPWQATLRRTGKVIQGLSGIVSAVKGFDLNGFVEGLGNLQQGFEGATQAFRLAKDAYRGVASLAEGGQGLLEGLKEGLSFQRKRAWYQALRGADILIEAGQFAKLRKLICEAPCRNDPAFQWGLCQRLGDIAANTMWDANIRQGAVALLGEIYQNDAIWGNQANIKQYTLDVLMQLASPSMHNLQCAQVMLQELETDGDLLKQALYRKCRDEGPSSHPLKNSAASLASPSLLDRVQSKPDVEAPLGQLRKLRLKEKGNAVYIPPQAKASLQAPDDALFPLMDKVKEFLSSDQKVLLLLGDSGAGKSTFNRELECDLWKAYKSKTGPIPLYINLPAIDKPQENLIAKQLLQANFKQEQIRELKDYREFILICDGYDESQQTRNLYTSNLLNQPGEWNVKMVISCRSEYIGRDYRDRFQPLDHNRRSQPWLFQEAVFTPFSLSQVRDYITQYVTLQRPLWELKHYLRALDQIPSLRELVKNPFLLTLALEVLPRMVDPGDQLEAARVTRVTLYDQFVEQWLERGKKRLGEKGLNPQEKGAFDSLSDEGFAQNGIDFLKKLAMAVYKEQGGQPVVEYSHVKDEGSWKNAFFGREDEKKLLREASPLTRNGNQYRFIHRSILEYGLARAVFDPEDWKKKETIPESTSKQRRQSTSSIWSFEIEGGLVEIPVVTEQEEPVDLTSPLVWRSFVSELSLLQFLQDRVQQEPIFKQQLLTFLEKSKTDRTWRIAAANAITILVRAGVQFNGSDLQGIQIPGADLSHGVFDSVRLQGADMRKVDLRNVWLRQADLSRAQMTGVQFGELPFLPEESKITSCEYSPDGYSLAVGLYGGNINVYSTSSWERQQTLSGHADQVVAVTFSPSSDQIASGSVDSTIRLWNMETGTCCHVLIGHTDWVTSVAYSPKGDLVASGSNDGTIWLWIVETGVCLHTLSGHESVISNIVYSPRGNQVISGSWDMTVRFWDVESGTCRQVLSGHQGDILKVACSQDGRKIASASGDKTTRLWDADTGECLHTLSGHSEDIWTVVFSPKCNQVATGSWDRTIRLWDVANGTCLHILRGHTGAVSSVAYSPKGDHVVSCSDDKTVRSWDTETGECRRTFSSHSDRVTLVMYSPKVNLVVSASDDMTVRLWDMEAGDSSRDSSANVEHNQVANSSGSLSNNDAPTPSGVMYIPIPAITDIAFSQNGGQIAASGDDYIVRLMDVRTGACQYVLNHIHGATSVAYPPKGSRVATASADSTVNIWNSETGTCLHTLRHDGPVYNIVYSPEGDQIASGSEDMTVRVWDAETGAPHRVFRSKNGGVALVVYSLKADLIVSACKERKVWIWDVESGTCLHVINDHKRFINNILFTPEGNTFFTASNDSTLRQWDIGTGACLHILNGHDREVTSAALSPQGHQIVSGSEDTTVRLWDVGSVSCQHILRGHTMQVTKVVYSLKGNLVVSASHDRTVRVWDSTSGQCKAVIQTSQRRIENMAWTTDHEVNYLVTGCEEGTLRLWQIIEGEDQCHVYLRWSSKHKVLAVAGASIQDATGLSQMNKQLLKQHGAVEEAILGSPERDMQDPQ